MYGFHKHRNSKDQNNFRHQKFKRGHLELAEIRRKPEKKKKAAALTKGQNPERHGIESMMHNDTAGHEMAEPNQNYSSSQSVSIESEAQKDNSSSSESEEMSAEAVEQAQNSSNNNPQSNPNNPPLFKQGADINYMCEILLMQNRILTQKQVQLRDTILFYKQREVQLQRESIRYMQSLNYQMPPSENYVKSTLISNNLRRLDAQQTHQTDFMTRMTYDLNKLSQELQNTNFNSLSTTSIQAASNMRIEDPQFQMHRSMLRHMGSC